MSLAASAQELGLESVQPQKPQVPEGRRLMILPPPELPTPPELVSHRGMAQMRRPGRTRNTLPQEVRPPLQTKL